MTYINERDEEPKELKYLVLIDNETRYRISEEYGELVITKIDFNDDVITIRPKVRNQISIK